MPQIYWIAEVSRWFAFGCGVVGIGATPNEALAAWMVDLKRLQPALAATTGDK